MDRVLFVCKTPFQIITAIALRLQHFQYDQCDILLAPEFSGIEEIVERMKNFRLFKNCYLGYKAKNPTKLMLGYNFTPKIEIKKYFPDIYKNRYSLLFTNGISSDMDNALYYALHFPEPIFYDEGYSSYTNQFLKANERISSKHMTTRNIARVFHQHGRLHEHVKTMYLYDPTLCVHDMPYETKKIWESGVLTEIHEIIRYIFDVGKAIEEYDKKFIFFEECFASDFGNNGDIPLIEEILTVVDKNDLIIKLHPRDKTNRFHEMGIKTNTIYSTPAEGLISEFSKSNHVLLTFSSGSVINYKFISDNNVPTVFLYKLMPKSFIEMPEDRLMWFDKYILKYGKDIYVPENNSDLKKVLKKLYAG